MFESKSHKIRFHSRTNSVVSETTHVPSRRGWWREAFATVIVLGLGIGLIVLFFHWDRAGVLSNAIRSYGALGILLSIFLMAAFCVIPVPSEFLMILNMKVYGVWWGIFYTWIGAMLGAIAVFYIARFTGRRLLAKLVSPGRVHQVETWVERRGAVGLLLARFVPLPFIVVNYTAGVLKSVRIRDYIWTTGIGLLPYDIGAAFVFIGFSKRFLVWLVAGGIAIFAFWSIGWYLQRKSRQSAALK